MGVIILLIVEIQFSYELAINIKYNIYVNLCKLHTSVRPIAGGWGVPHNSEAPIFDIILFCSLLKHSHKIQIMVKPTHHLQSSRLSKAMFTPYLVVFFCF